MQTATLWLITIKTPHQLDTLSLQTYILGAITGAVFLLLAAFISLAIQHEGGAHPKDPGKRKRWFWILIFVAFSCCFIYNMFVVAPTIAANLQSKYMTTNLIASALAFLSYFILGFVTSKLFPNGKLGNWFSSRK